jgi:primary-amine oxidase
VQSVAGEGLPAWTKADRPIVDTDLVVWYTLGIHHLPSAEDFPVMPTRWVGFNLRPFDFFSRNPAIDLQR